MWFSFQYLFLLSPLIYSVDFVSTTRGSPSCRMYLRGAYLWIWTWVLTTHIYIYIYSPLSIRVTQELFWVSFDELNAQLEAWDIMRLCLDLMHYRCNRIYVPWVNKGVRRTEFIRNIISESIKNKSHYIIVWYFGRVFKHDRKLVSAERLCYQTEYIHAGLGFTEITDDSNIIQVPAIQTNIQVSEEPAAADSSILPDKVLLMPPTGSVPHLARHPPLSITTNFFGSPATPIKYSMASPCPIFCTGRCREEPENDVELKADVVRARRHQCSTQPLIGS
jgi:hypothetical protein